MTRKKANVKTGSVIESKKAGSYSPHNFDSEWRKKRAEIIRRDEYACMRCGNKPSINKLTVHHFKPRNKGGGDYSANLITLCRKCHDYVEIRELRSVADIVGSYPDTELATKKYPKRKSWDVGVAYRPEWNDPAKKNRRRKKKPNLKRIYGPIYELAQLFAQGYDFEYINLYGKVFGITIKTKGDSWHRKHGMKPHTARTP